MESLSLFMLILCSTMCDVCCAESRLAEEHSVPSSPKHTLGTKRHKRLDLHTQVTAPPQPPQLYLARTTISTIQVNWLSGSNGGSAIQGFVLNYKKEHEPWKTITLGPTNRTHIADNLRCGTAYKFSIRAYNRLGASVDSVIVSARTNGSAPIGPPQSMLLKEVNVNSVELDLGTWLTSGCPVGFYSVKYCVWGDEHWVLVSNSIKSNTTVFTVQDLQPATWYTMSVIAHTDAGSTESELHFATLTYTGSAKETTSVEYSNTGIKNSPNQDILLRVLINVFLVSWRYQ